MKKTPGFGATPGKQTAENFSATDKKKLIVMGVILFFVTIAYFGSVITEKGYREKEHDQADLERPDVEEIYVPEFDFAALSAELDDSEDGEKRIEKAPLARLLEHVKLLTTPQYDALNTVNVTAEESAVVLADPTANRGRGLRARGTIENLIERTGDDDDKHFEGRLRLEDDSVCYFVIDRLPEDKQGPADKGTFVRIDGRFMKGHRAETDNGWERGPLVVGRHAVFSYESVGERVTNLPASVMALVEDDSLTGGTQGDPFTAYWTMLAYARDLEEGDIDWAAVPELNNELLAEILKDGAKYRAQPFRIPVSVNMETRQLTIKENPARLESISQGWIGNQLWSSGNGLIKFNGHFANPYLERRDLVVAKGFFFRNHLYEPSKGGAALAPLFILADIEKFTPKEDTVVPMIFMGVVVLTLALVGLLWVLLMRDKRKSNQLSEELIRRRRERRERQAAAGTPNPGQT